MWLSDFSVQKNYLEHLLNMQIAKSHSGNFDSVSVGWDFRCACLTSAACDPDDLVLEHTLET